jgi:hypothetical protein
VVALIAEGVGVLALKVCGTLRFTSRPEGESPCVVVGLAERLGLKVSLSQPVVAGKGAMAWSVP